jgi:hypothetical protein
MTAAIDRRDRLTGGWPIDTERHRDGDPNVVIVVLERINPRSGV